MSRIIDELDGVYGLHFQTYARDKMAQIVNEYKNGEITVRDGVAYNAIGRVLDTELAEILDYSKESDIDLIKTVKARGEQESIAVEAYRRRKEQLAKEGGSAYSEEELFELRTALKTCAKVVDILTGETVSI